MDGILRYSNLDDIILTGDFNARTGKCDFVPHDDCSIDKKNSQTS